MVRAFSQLLQFQFYAGPDSTTIFGNKSATQPFQRLRPLYYKDDKLRSIFGAHAFNSVLDTSAPWAGKLNGVYLPPL